MVNDRIKTCVNFTIVENNIMPYDDNITCPTLIKFINDIYDILGSCDKNTLNYINVQRNNDEYSVCIVYKFCSNADVQYIFDNIKRKYKIGAFGYYTSLKKVQPKPHEIIYLKSDIHDIILGIPITINMNTFIQSNEIKGNLIRNKVSELIERTNSANYMGLNGESIIYGYKHRKLFDKCYFVMDNNSSTINPSCFGVPTDIICDKVTEYDFISYANNIICYSEPRDYILVCNKRNAIINADLLLFKYIIFIICDEKVYNQMIELPTYNLVELARFEDEFSVSLFKKIET